MPPVPRSQSANGAEINKIAPQLMAMAVDIDSLVPDPDNARIHPESNMQTIRASLAKYGQVHPLVCRESTRVIIAGNGRWQAAKDLRWTKIAAHFVSISEVDAAGLGLVDNRSAELAMWDYKVVTRLQRLMISCGDKALGWGDEYIYVIAEAPEWNPTVTDGSDANEEDKTTTVNIKVPGELRRLLESCLNMIKKRRSSPKKMTDAQALSVLLNEWTG